MYSLLKDKVMELIRKKGVSVRSVERDLGFGYSTIQYWDVHMPSIDKVEKIAKYFNVSVDYLLGNEIPDGDNYEVVAKLEKMTAHDVKIVKLYNKASEDDKKVIDMILGKYDL